MCYNCGCGMLENDMGNPKNITEKTFREAAQATGLSLEQTKKNVYESLKKQVESK